MPTTVTRTCAAWCVRDHSRDDYPGGTRASQRASRSPHPTATRDLSSGKSSWAPPDEPFATAEPVVCVVLTGAANFMTLADAGRVAD